MNAAPWYSIYRSPRLYRWAMAALYGEGDRERFEAVMARIPLGRSVLDVCCGPGRLGLELRARGPGSYRGIELNAPLWAFARRRGLEVMVGDVREVALPEADHVVLMSSLYQFRQEAEVLLERLQAAARVDVILTEPVKNLAGGSSRLLRELAGHMTDAGRGPERERFDARSLEALVRRCGAVELARLCGGREVLARLPGSAAGAVTPSGR